MLSRPAPAAGKAARRAELGATVHGAPQHAPQHAVRRRPPRARCPLPPRVAAEECQAPEAAARDPGPGGVVSGGGGGAVRLALSEPTYPVSRRRQAPPAAFCRAFGSTYLLKLCVP